MVVDEFECFTVDKRLNDFRQGFGDEGSDFLTWLNLWRHLREQQPADLPKLQFSIDRAKAAELGLAERDVANSVLLSLSGST